MQVEHVHVKIHGFFQSCVKLPRGCMYTYTYTILYIYILSIDMYI